MTIVRCAAGLAAVVSAMLVQATVIGPLVYPVPVSLPLLVVVGVAVLSGPSTGIALGFGAGLLADLSSRHPVGMLALTWLGAGIVAGIVGGLVMEPSRVHPSVRGAATRRRPYRPGRRRVREPRFGPSDAGPGGMSRWRAQGLLTGLISVAATGVGMLALAATGSADLAVPGALVLLVPAGLLDAMLAVPLVALIRIVLTSPALRPVVAVRLGGATTVATATTVIPATVTASTVTPSAVTPSAVTAFTDTRTAEPR